MFLLRILLPDQPGMLGTVASAVGRAGGDIAAVDVIERASGGAGDHAIDDIVVDLPPDTMVDSLVSACQSVDGVSVLWVSRYDAGNNLRRDLEAVEAMATDPHDVEQVLVRQAPLVFRADWALLTVRDVDRVEVAYATPNAPDLVDENSPWPPVTRPEVMKIPDGWEENGWRNVAAAIVPVGSPAQTLVVGRNGGPEFLASELARLGHLAGLAATISNAN